MRILYNRSMKKIAIGVTLPFLILLSYFLVRNIGNRTFSESSASIGNKEDKNVKGLKSDTVTFNEKEYSYEKYVVSDVSRLKLIPNFTGSISANDAIDKYKCEFLTNGGFYQDNDANSGEKKPIGLFVYDTKSIGKWSQNRLFDGILSINDFETPRITRITPEDQLRFAVQTGPILIENGNVIKLLIRNDKPERRIVTAVTGDNTLVFYVLYNDKQYFSGPSLTDLPGILKAIEKDSGIDIADAINMDGGTASTFISSDIKLLELTPVGSFICVN
jgi:uncharacterized protein YigE (DUF2233 family)